MPLRRYKAWLLACMTWSSVAGAAAPGSAEGEGLFLARCGTCHMAPKPQSHTAKEWPWIVQRMAHHRLMNGFTLLSEAEQRLITEYLQRGAKLP